MRTLLIALLALACAPMAHAKYRPMSLVEVLMRADLVVVGEITELKDGTVIVKVEQTAIGEAPDGKPLIVQKFADWPCASRYAPYAKGQRLLWCLTKGANNGPYRALGAGNEGELPISKGFARFTGPGLPQPAGGAKGGIERAAGLPLADLIKIARGLKPLVKTDAQGRVLARDIAKLDAWAKGSPLRARFAGQVLRK